MTRQTSTVDAKGLKGHFCVLFHESAKLLSHESAKLLRLQLYTVYVQCSCSIQLRSCKGVDGALVPESFSICIRKVALSRWRQASQGYQQTVHLDISARNAVNLNLNLKICV